MAEPILPMVIRDVMVTDVVKASKDQTVSQVVQMMKSKSIGCVVITEGSVPVGIVTERDIIHKVIAANRNPKKTLLQDIMSPGVISLEGSKAVEDAVDLMEKKNIKKLPVVDGGKLVGIVTMTDMIRILRQIEKSMLKKLKEGFLDRNR